MTDVDVPRTDAHALHALLVKVAAEGPNRGLHAPWAVVFGVDAETAEFAKCHGEVVTLLNTVVSQIEMLPPRSRSKYERYVPMWWSAVVVPDMRWNAGLPSAIVEEVHLDLLHALGDITETAFAGSALSPGGQFITELQTNVEGWLTDLETDPSILPSNAHRLSLIESLKHILWLIEHRDEFGDARIAQAAQQTVGAIALSAPHVPEEKRHTWRKKAVELAGVIAIFNGIVGGTQTAIESTGTAVVEMIDAGETIVGELVDEG